MKFIILLLTCYLCCSCSFVVVKKGNDLYVRDSTNFNGTTEVELGKLKIKRVGIQDAATATNAVGNQIVRGMAVGAGGAIGL